MQAEQGEEEEEMGDREAMQIFRDVPITRTFTLKEGLNR